MKIISICMFCLIVVTSVPAQMTTDIVNMGSTTQSFITIQGISISSIGEFKESWDKGSGIYAGYAWLYPSQFALVLQTGYFSFQENEEAEISGDAHFSIIPIAIGGRYYIVADRFRPFLLAMSGINIVRQNYTKNNRGVEKTKTHLHFQVGLGLGIKLFSQLEIEGQAKYNCHVLEPSLPYNITGLEYGVALNWHL